MTTEIDSQVSALFDVVAARKAEISKMQATISRGWITNCNYRIDREEINIQTANLAAVVRIMTDIVMRRSAKAEAVEALGLKGAAGIEEDAINGFAFESWIADLNKRVASLSIAEKNKALSNLEDRLNQIVSPEQRRAMELQAITATLEKL